jgi:hypothetical protein
MICTNLPALSEPNTTKLGRSCLLHQTTSMIGTKNKNQEGDNKPFQKRKPDPLMPKEK